MNAVGSLDSVEKDVACLHLYTGDLDALLVP